jgi:hypothetical protein
MTTATAPAQNTRREIVLSGGDAPKLTPFEVIERVITSGDLANMAPDARIAFYWRTCESLGLNPLTRPFEFITLNGKLTMYARKDATDQLRKVNGVSVTSIRREVDNELGLATVYAKGVDRTGREDEGEGVVTIKGLSGEALANALMKAATKAKRRLTLSLVGLGFLDESELPEGTAPDVDALTGELVTKAKPKSLLESVQEQQAKLAETSETTAVPEYASPTTSDAPPADEPLEGLFTEVVDEAPAGPDSAHFADTIRASAEASGLTGALTTPMRGSLAKALAGIGEPAVLAGLRALWPDAVTDGRITLTAARGQAVLNGADSLGPEAFAAAWTALAEGGAK